MPIVDVKYGWSGNPATVGEKRVTAERVGTIKTDSTADTAVTLIGDSSVPQRGDVHPDDPNATLKVSQVFIRQIGIMFFSIRVLYATGDLGSTDQNPTNNPLDAPARIRVTSHTTQEHVDEALEENDTTGRKTITNTALEPFDPPSLYDVTDIDIEIERNEPFLDWALWFAYFNATNSDAFLGFEPGVVRMLAISAEDVIEGELTYYKVSYRFRVRSPQRASNARAWYLRILNQGFRLWKSSDPATGLAQYEQFVDESGYPLTSPTLLDVDGQALPTADDPIWLEFQVYPSKPFGVFGFA